MQKIVVGVDGSESAGEAVDWVMARASGEDVVLLAHTWPIPAMSGYELQASSLHEFEDAARKLVTDLAAKLEYPGGPTIETEVRSGHAGLRLAELSADADLVVVGSRGYGGIRSTLLGSVSTYLAHHAKCPVVIMRGGDPDDQPQDEETD